MINLQPDRRIRNRPVDLCSVLLLRLDDGSRSGAHEPDSGRLDDDAQKKPRRTSQRREATLSGPWAVLLRSPELVDPVPPLTILCGCSTSTLSPRLSEFVILITAPMGAQRYDGTRIHQLGAEGRTQSRRRQGGRGRASGRQDGGRTRKSPTTSAPNWTAITVWPRRHLRQSRRQVRRAGLRIVEMVSFTAITRSSRWC